MRQAVGQLNAGDVGTVVEPRNAGVGAGPLVVEVVHGSRAGDDEFHGRYLLVGFEVVGVVVVDDLQGELEIIAALAAGQLRLLLLFVDGDAVDVDGRLAVDEEVDVRILIDEVTGEVDHIVLEVIGRPGR